MLDKIYIRKMKENDIKNIYQIIISSHLLHPPFQISEESILNQFKWSNQYPESHEHYVVEYEGCVVGYCVVHWIETFLYTKPEGYISELFIDEHYRGKRIVTTLLNFVIDKAKEKNCYRLWLLNTEGSESHTRQYYFKQGWTHSEKDIRYILYLSS